MTTATDTLTTPTLPARTAPARPWLWGANDARIAARIDEATATADPRTDADDMAAAYRACMAAL